MAPPPLPNQLGRNQFGSQSGEPRRTVWSRNSVLSRRPFSWQCYFYDKTVYHIYKMAYCTQAQAILQRPSPKSFPAQDVFCAPQTKSLSPTKMSATMISTEIPILCVLAQPGTKNQKTIIKVVSTVNMTMVLLTRRTQNRQLKNDENSIWR